MSVFPGSVHCIYKVAPFLIARSNPLNYRVFRVLEKGATYVLINFFSFLGCIHTVYSCAKDLFVIVQIPEGLKITEMTSSKLSFIFTGFLWVKTPEKA